MHFVGYLGRVKLHLTCLLPGYQRHLKYPYRAQSRHTRKKTASIHGNLQDGGESGSRKNWLVNCDSSLQHSINSFARAESNKHVEHVKPSNNAPFDVLKFDILIRKTVFQEAGWVVGWTEVSINMLTGFSLLSSRRFWLVRHFTARSPTLTESGLAQANLLDAWGVKGARRNKLLEK